MSALNLRKVDAAAVALQHAAAGWRNRGAAIHFHSAGTAALQADARYIAFHAGDAGNPQGGWNGLIRCEEWLANVAPALAALATTDGGVEHARQLFAVTPQPLTTDFPYHTITVTGIVPGTDLQHMPLAALSAPEATVWLQALPLLPHSLQPEQDAAAAAANAPIYGIGANLQFLLGYSRLSSGTLSRVGPGDVLLVTDHALRMRCSGLVLGWYSITDEGIIVDELLEETYEQIAEAAVHADPEESGDNAAQGGIERIPVMLEFVLQQNKITIGELGQLHAGQVIDLAPDAEKSVLVLANGAVLGRGELIQLEDRLGVEMIDIYGSGDHAN
jgi:type III secretion protein Q